MKSWLRALRGQWRRNYRHHGFGALCKCLAGSATLRLRPATSLAPPSAVPDLEFLTFSVVPWLTAAWIRQLGDALTDDAVGNRVSIIVGDSSGGFGAAQRDFVKGRRPVVATGALRLQRCFNDHHGEKIDLFLGKVCRAPYVLLSDDDVFWLGPAPLQWALDRFAAEPNLAVVSLQPRKDVSGLMARGGIHRPMGSHCLLIRRETLLRERIRFAVAQAPEDGDDWFYDTADLAHLQLRDRGYGVELAPEILRRQFVVFDGASSWILKLQSSTSSQLTAAVGDVTLRRRKALEALHLVRELEEVVAGSAARPVSVLPESRRAACEYALEAVTTRAERDAARESVARRFETLRATRGARAN